MSGASGGKGRPYTRAKRTRRNGARACGWHEFARSANRLVGRFRGPYLAAGRGTKPGPDIRHGATNRMTQRLTWSLALARLTLVAARASPGPASALRPECDGDPSACFWTEDGTRTLTVSRTA